MSYLHANTRHSGQLLPLSEQTTENLPFTVRIALDTGLGQS